MKYATTNSSHCISPDSSQDINIEYTTPSGTNIKKTFFIGPNFIKFILIRCLLSFFHSKPSDKYKIYNYTDFSVTQALINYIENNYETPESVPASVLKSYSLYLSLELNHPPSSIRAYISNINKILKWCIGQAWFHLLPDNDKSFILSVYIHSPPIPENDMTSNTFPAMSELSDKKEYDDLELLDSLIFFSLGFLLEFKKHRDIILSHRGVNARIEMAKKSDSRDIDWRYKDPMYEDYDEIFNAIVGSRETTLIERILITNPKFLKTLETSHHPADLSDLYRTLKSCVRFNSGSLQPASQSAHILFEQLDIRSLASSTEAEEICLHWLFASDRIQTSGQKQLQIDDIEITPTHLTINYLKRRGEEIEKESTTHRRKTHNYQVIAYHHTLRKQFEYDFPQSSFQHRNFFQYSGYFTSNQNRAAKAYKPLVVACTPSSNLYQAVVERFPKATLFQEYFLEIIEKNTAAYKYSKSGKDRNDVDEEESSEMRRQRLTTNVIAQSRAIVDPLEPKTSSPFDRYSSETVAANGAAHTPKVSKEVYKSRSRTAHRLTNRAQFVRTVGNLQEDDARKVSTLLNRTKFASITEINDFLGWDVSSFKSNDIEEFNQLIARAEQSGYACTPFGYLTKPNTTERIIVKTPVVAALIISFIKGCQLELKNSTTDERDHALLMQLSYAKLVLKEFDQGTIFEGKELLRTYNFPPVIL